MHHDLLTDILLLLATAVVFVIVCRRLLFPPVLAYLFVGMLVGPAALGWIDNNNYVRLLGETGIAFLLFSIGLEFSWPQLLKMRHYLIGLGLLQVLVGTLSGAVIAWWIGIPVGAAIIVGGALSMSSTAIVLKQLTDQGEIQERYGRLALGILLFQDLAAVVFMVMIPVLAAGDDQSLAMTLALALLKGVFAIGVVLALGRWALRPIFLEVTRTYSAELFSLTVLLVCLFAAWLTSLMGLSLALGAFLAGMMISETEFRHLVESELRPFKDLLLGLFFVSIGMQLDLALLPAVWPWVLLLVVGLVLGKGALIALLAWWLERDRVMALRSGIILGHGGEFGFALLSLALGTGLLQSTDSQPILLAIVLSMVLAPLLVRHNRQLVNTPVAGATALRAEEIAGAVEDSVDHIIICGFGRVGGQVAELLRSQSIAWTALDLHAEAAKRAWEDGDRVFFGDAGQPEILCALGLERASALVISFENEKAALDILNTVKSGGFTLPVVARCEDERAAVKLLEAGATEVIPANRESSQLLVVGLMNLLHIPAERISACLQASRDALFGSGSED